MWNVVETSVDPSLMLEGDIVRRKYDQLRQVTTGSLRIQKKSFHRLGKPLARFHPPTRQGRFGAVTSTLAAAHTVAISF